VLIICIYIKSNVIHFLSSFAGEVNKPGKIITFSENNFEGLYPGNDRQRYALQAKCRLTTIYVQI